MMFCKPPCPDEPELALVPNASDNQSGLAQVQSPARQHGFGRSIASETAGPEQRLPPVAARTG